jgi:hypothetical protein
MAVADNDFYLSLGGAEVTGFAENAIKFPALPEKIKSKKGLDTVAWMKQNLGGMELEVSIFLMADSPSVKILKTFEKTSAVVPFVFVWESLGVTVDALECIIEESGGLDVNTDMPELEFKAKIKNFVEMKGL